MPTVKVFSFGWFYSILNTNVFIGLVILLSKLVGILKSVLLSNARLFSETSWASFCVMNCLLSDKNLATKTFFYRKTIKKWQHSVLIMGNSTNQIYIHQNIEKYHDFFHQNRPKSLYLRGVCDIICINTYKI